MHLYLFAPKLLITAAVVASAAALIPTAALATPAASATPARDATPACQTSGLDIWAAANRGSAYAGGYYDTIYLTNMSGQACTLSGHAGVTAVGLSGSQIGSPAGWAGPAPALVKLPQDATAAILVQVGDPARLARGGNRPDCGSTRRTSSPRRWPRFPSRPVTTTGQSGCTRVLCKAP